MKKQLILYYFLFILIPIHIYPTHAEVIGFTDDQVWTKILNNEDILIIDTRSYASYLESHIPTAIYLEFNDPVDPNLVVTISDYGKSENILYCSCTDGSTSKHFAEELSNLVLSTVFYMSDDFRDWTYETVNGPDPGSIDTNNSSISTNEDNDQNNTPEIVLTDLFSLNLALLLIVIFILILKKKK